MIFLFDLLILRNIHFNKKIFILKREIILIKKMIII